MPPVDSDTSGQEVLSRVPHGVEQDGLWPATWTSWWASFEALIDFVATIHTACNTTVQCESRVFAEHAFARAFPGDEFRHKTPERGYFTCTHPGKKCPYRISFAYNYHMNLYMILNSTTRLLHSHDIVAAPHLVSPRPEMPLGLKYETLLAEGSTARAWPTTWPAAFATFEDLQAFVAIVQSTFETSLARDSRNFSPDVFTKLFPGEILDLRRIQRGFFGCSAADGPKATKRDKTCGYRIHFSYDVATKQYTINTAATHLVHNHATKKGAVELAAELKARPRTRDKEASSSFLSAAKPKVGIITPAAKPKPKVGIIMPVRASSKSSGSSVSKSTKKKQRRNLLEDTDESDAEGDDVAISEYDEVELDAPPEEDRYETLFRDFQAIYKKAMGNTLYYQYAKVVLANLNAPDDRTIEDDEDDAVVVTQPPKKRKIDDARVL
ncbi:hypothetical protein ACHHYP_00711 [Achlya hypogyna]|uniref:Uncharacterized protein n=1 Tax=Achlya hypogyna TaxID=1202772 RepID=A0A1V9ZU59_ACHHY|nr:hypothetical protein ACHHYP_00711 [Achlya hypogyna]